MVFRRPWDFDHGNKLVAVNDFRDDEDVQALVGGLGAVGGPHSHSPGEVSGLQTVLDGKSNTGHVHSLPAHQHPVGDIDASGSPGPTTFLRGDGVWGVPPAGDGGGGAVDSVNGQTGAVVLDAADVGAQPTGSYATGAQGQLAATAVQPGDLAGVATSGAYGDLTGTPSIPATAADVGAVTAGDVTHIVALSQAAYDALNPPAASTLYLITGA